MKQEFLPSRFTVVILAAIVCLSHLGCGGSDMSQETSDTASPVDLDSADAETQEYYSEREVAGSEAEESLNDSGALTSGAKQARDHVSDDSVVPGRNQSQADGALELSAGDAPATTEPKSVAEAPSEKPSRSVVDESITQMPAPLVADRPLAATQQKETDKPGEGDGKALKNGLPAGDTVAPERRPEDSSSPTATAGKSPEARMEQSRRAIRQRSEGLTNDLNSISGGFGGGQANEFRNKKSSGFAESAPAPGGSEAKHQLSKDLGQKMKIELQAGEELWVIARSDAVPAENGEDVPGTGSLVATLPGEQKNVPVPLKHTAVEGTVDGYVATVDVRQEFQNPFDSKIEASYVFPLPQNSAVNEFVMTIGTRKIRGIIRERERAEKIYATAREQGHVAALLTQNRPNIFTQKVANIDPGKKIDINIRYFSTLRYDDGAYEFVFPMVVAPRFNPTSSPEGIGVVAHGNAGGSGRETEVPYLAPNERSGHEVSVSLKISAGVQIESIHSVNHDVSVKNSSDTERLVTLNSNDLIPNKDFVVRYQVAGDRIKTAMLTHEDKNGKYFTMMLYPPADLAQVKRCPMEMVFVLDCSGSMSGQPVAQAKAAISHALQSLTPRDTFQIIRFSNNASQLGTEPVPASEANIKRGLQYLTSLNGGGGTQMIEGIKAALDFPHDEGRFRLVSFMTDGQIGNERQILGTLHEKLGASRVFCFGVGSSPNRFLMNRMAVLGKGAVAYLSLNDNATEIMDRFNQRISHPAMTDLAIDWGDMRVADVYPQRLPDLIVGRPIVLTGRFKGEPGNVKVNGRVEMQPASFSVSLNEQDAAKEHGGIAAVWARLKIKDMMNYATLAPEAADEIKQAVTETALTYNLMSTYTSFVAVDSLTKTKGTVGTTVAVPVPVPDGVRYDATVPNNAN